MPLRMSPGAMLGAKGSISACDVNSVSLGWLSSSYHILFAEADGIGSPCWRGEKGQCPESSQPGEGGRGSRGKQVLTTESSPPPPAPRPPSVLPGIVTALLPSNSRDRVVHTSRANPHTPESRRKVCPFLCPRRLEQGLDRKPS